MLSDSHERARVLAPPPVLFLGTLAVGVALDFFVLRLQTGIPDLWRFSGGALLVVAGVILLALAVGSFQKAGTGVRHKAGTSALVTTGVHGLTRNPMYVGMALVYLGLALPADSGIALALFVPLIVIVQVGVIAREEVFMAARFGADYDAYRKRVRRWL